MSNLEYLRSKANLPQARVATQAGISTSAYCMYEQGKRAVPKDIAVRIAEIIGCAVDDIFLPEKFTVSEFPSSA